MSALIITVLPDRSAEYSEQLRILDGCEATGDDAVLSELYQDLAEKFETIDWDILAGKCMDKAWRHARAVAAKRGESHDPQT